MACEPERDIRFDGRGSDGDCGCHVGTGTEGKVDVVGNLFQKIFPQPPAHG